MDATQQMMDAAELLQARWPTTTFTLDLIANEIRAEMCPDRNNQPVKVLLVVCDGKFSATSFFEGISKSTASFTDTNPVVALETSLRLVSDHAGLHYQELKSKTRRLLEKPYREPTSTHEGAQAEAVAYMKNRFPGCKVEAGDESAKVFFGDGKGGSYNLTAFFNSWRMAHRGEWYVVLDLSQLGQISDLESKGVYTTSVVALGAHTYGPDLGECVEAALKRFVQTNDLYLKGLDAFRGHLGPYTQTESVPV